eukprot:jgi/Mesen1/3761/ME000205S03016
MALIFAPLLPLFGHADIIKRQLPTSAGTNPPRLWLSLGPNGCHCRASTGKSTSNFGSISAGKVQATITSAEELSNALTVLAKEESNDSGVASTSKVVITEDDKAVISSYQDELGIVLHVVEDEDVEEVESLLKGPILGRYPGRQGRQNIMLFLALGLDRAQVARMFNGCQALCNFDGANRLLPKLKIYLQHGLDLQSILMASSRRPQIFAFTEEQFSDVLLYLKEFLTADEMGSVIASCPQLLGLTVANLRAKQAYLESQGVKDVGRSLVKNPKLLTYSLDTLPPKLQSLRELAGVENISSAISMHPQLLGMNIQTLQETFKGLAETYGRENTMKMFHKQPAILQRSWLNVKEKLDFFENVMGRDIRDVLKDPNILTVSLEATIKPRYFALKESGDPDKYSLSSLFSSSRGRFTSFTGISYRKPKDKDPDEG